MLTLEEEYHSTSGLSQLAVLCNKLKHLDAVCTNHPICLQLQPRMSSSSPHEMLNPRTMTSEMKRAEH